MYGKQYLTNDNTDQIHQQMHISVSGLFDNLLRFLYNIYIYIFLLRANLVLIISSFYHIHMQCVLMLVLTVDTVYKAIVSINIC